VLASEAAPLAAWPAATGAEPSRGRVSAEAAARLLRGHWRL
jgi:hypothetical protein